MKLSPIERSPGAKAADELTDTQQQLAAMRRLSFQPGTREIDSPEREELYEPAKVVIFPGVELDPQRPVLKAWLRTPYDRSGAMSSYKMENNAAGRIDAGEGFGVSVKTSTVYKVRSLRRPTLGEVREVTSLQYWIIKRESIGRNIAPRWEPVGADTKVCEPIFPPTFPTDPAKARKLAARGLRKDADTLTFSEILDYFRKLKIHNESFSV